MLLLLLACATDGVDDTSDVSACFADLAVGEIVPLAGGFSSGTEGIAFSGGALYVTAPGAVSRVSAAGEVAQVATVDHALGLAPAAGGLLLADPGEFTFDGTGDDGRLLHVATDGALTVRFQGGLPNPNFLAAVGDEVLVSDDTTVIYTADSGVWLDTVPSPNGMGLSPDGATLYVVSTFAPDPPLWRVPLSDGAPGTPEVVTTFPTGAAPDGLAVDAEGQVWVALNLDNELVRIDPATGEQTARVTGLTTPASLAFGAGDGFDPCSLYVTELYGETVWRVATGIEGLPIAEAAIGGR